MPRAAEFRELLFADLALLGGHADARQVAAALLKYWDRRDRIDTTLAQELAKVAGITSEELGTLQAEVDALVSASEGDAHLALTRHGGIAHELHAAVSRKDGDVSRQLTELGAGIRVTLRTLPKDRYLDFMPVGEGGMGIVYWAMDTELGRQVAFKVVRPPTDGPGAGVTPPAPVHMRAPEGTTSDAFEELKARFLQEAWVTGGMEHPGIVPVYELGLTEGGVPYYTMRFVRGRRTLETAIDEIRERPFDERSALLEPFLKVCDAIAYAHSRGVVHRDIKPANVAMGDYGEAIVIDWGLAKLAGHPDVHASRWQAHVTDFRAETEMQTLASALGTPGYMAPEAAARDVANVDQVSDVYSLGVILFEIVTGRRPVEFRTFAEYAERVQESDAPDARTIDAAVPPGLATLCASALSRERRMRPAQVADLAKGVRTWERLRAKDREIDVLLAEAEGALTETEGMSVLAMRTQSERAAAACQRVLDLRPGEQRARELLQRARELGEAGHRAKTQQATRALIRRVAVATLVVVAVVGTVVAYLLEQRRREAESAREIARTERDSAARHRNRAEEAMGFITEELREALEPEGRLDVLAQIGEKARAHFHSIPVTEESAKGFRQRMRALRQLGEVYLAQGNLPKARGVFEEAVTASEGYAARDSASDLAQYESGRALINLARVDHAQGYPRRGSKRIRGVVDRMSGSRLEAIDALEWTEVRIRALNALTRTLRGTSDHPRALDVSKQAHALSEDLLDHEQAGIRHRKLALETAMLAAAARSSGGDTEEALKLARDTLSDARQLSGSHPEDLTLDALELQAARVVAVICRYSNRFDEAERLMTAAVPEARRLVELRGDNYQWRDLLMRLLFLLGDAKSGPQQEFWRAPDVFAESYALAEALLEHDPSHAGWAFTLVNLCDRRANAVGADLTKQPRVRYEFRKRAAGYARKLSDLEPGNTRWRYLLAFTLGTLSSYTKDAEERLRLIRESRSHNRYALERVPNASDVPNFYLNMSIGLAALMDESAERTSIARETFDAYLSNARGNPAAYWAQHAVASCPLSFSSRFAGRDADMGEEAVRQAKVTLAWFAELRSEHGAPAPDLERGLVEWEKQLQALVSKAGG